MRMRKVMAAALTGLALIAITGTASASADLTWPPADVTPVHKTKAELQEQAAEFTAHQERTFPRIFRGAQDVVHGQWGGESAGSIGDGQQYLTSLSTLTYRVKVYARSAAMAATCALVSGAQLCAQTTSPLRRKFHAIVMPYRVSSVKTVRPPLWSLT